LNKIQSNNFFGEIVYYKIRESDNFAFCNLKKTVGFHSNMPLATGTFYGTQQNQKCSREDQVQSKI